MSRARNVWPGVVVHMPDVAAHTCNPKLRQEDFCVFKIRVGHRIKP